jgi:hypothetical protein
MISLKGGTRKTTLANTCYWTKSPLKMGHTAQPRGTRPIRKVVRSNDVAIVGMDKLCRSVVRELSSLSWCPTCTVHTRGTFVKDALLK